MSRISIFFTLALAVTVQMSCKKDQIPAQASASYPNYSQLAVGNYWIYERFLVDTNGVSTSQGIIDSCYVEKDTIINGKTYYKLIKPSQSFGSKVISFQRDSLHYIVNSAGKILFSSQDFTTVFSSRYAVIDPSDTLSLVETTMSDINFGVTVPAGTFSTNALKTTYNMYPNYTEFGSQRYRYTRYAENVGIVNEDLEFYLGNPNKFERRLIRYNIN